MDSLVVEASCLGFDKPQEGSPFTAVDLDHSSASGGGQQRIINHHQLDNKFSFGLAIASCFGFDKPQ